MNSDLKNLSTFLALSVEKKIKTMTNKKCPIVLIINLKLFNKNVKKISI